MSFNDRRKLYVVVWCMAALKHVGCETHCGKKNLNFFKKEDGKKMTGEPDDSHGARAWQKRQRPTTLTVTGASTRCTFPSFTSISLARRYIAFTSFSRRYSHRFSRSIWESNEEEDDDDDDEAPCPCPPSLFVDDDDGATDALVLLLGGMMDEGAAVVAELELAIEDDEEA